MAFDGNFICDSFKNELLKGEHQFGSNAFQIALFTSDAVGTSYGGSTTRVDNTITAYATTNEVSVTQSDGATASGYTAGGQALALASSTPKLDGSTAIVDFDDEEFTSSTFTARGAIIYNASSSNKAVAVLDFGEDKIVTGGTYTVVFPAPDSANAIIRIG